MIQRKFQFNFLGDLITFDGMGVRVVQDHPGAAAVGQRSTLESGGRCPVLSFLAPSQVCVNKSAGQSSRASTPTES